MNKSLTQKKYKRNYHELPTDSFTKHAFEYIGKIKGLNKYIYAMVEVKGTIHFSFLKKRFMKAVAVGRFDRNAIITGGSLRWRIQLLKFQQESGYLDLKGKRF